MHENAEPEAERVEKIGFENIAAPQGISDIPDKPTELETLSNENEKLEIENQGLKQDIAERKKYAHRIFCLISTWLASVLAIIILDGFGTSGIALPWIHLSFHLSEPVVLAIVGSTTLDVLGIFYIVTNYLFPKH